MSRPQPLIAAGVAASLAAAYLYRRSSVSSSSSSSQSDATLVEEELPCVPPEKVVAIFAKLCGLMNQHLTSLMRRINANGQNVPQQILAQYLVEHFEQQLTELQGHVFAEFGVTEEDLEEAVEYYEDDARSPEVVEATNQLRQLYVNVGGRVDLDLPETLNVETMCAVFEDYMAAVVSAQQAFTEHLHHIKAKGNMTSVSTSELQEARQAKIQEKVAVVLKKHGLNSLVFQAALEKFNDHPVFQAKIAAVKAKEAEKTTGAQQQQQKLQR